MTSCPIYHLEQLVLFNLRNLRRYFGVMVSPAKWWGALLAKVIIST
jgi:hypothetical protein